MMTVVMRTRITATRMTITIAATSPPDSPSEPLLLPTTAVALPTLSNLVRMICREIML